jgi:hypothetical protein
MKKKYHQCESCKQQFSRRWNALRHSKVVHSAAASIISNERKQNSRSKLQNRFYKYKNFFEILDFTEIDLYNEYTGYDIFRLNKNDIKIIKIIDQLIKPFNE